MMEKVRELAAQYQQAGNNCAETVEIGRASCRERV